MTNELTGLWSELGRRQEAYPDNHIDDCDQSITEPGLMPIEDTE